MEFGIFHEFLCAEGQTEKEAFRESLPLLCDKVSPHFN
jgi:hypothetical protein